MPLLVNHSPRPLLGYAMVWAAALLFAVNGSVAKVALESGLTSVELTQARSIGAAVGFGALVAILRPRAFRIERRELLHLVAFGVAGLAFVQWLYFAAIDRLPVGIALLIQYLAPLLVALIARFVLGERVRRRIWVALALALTGLGLVVELPRGEASLDGVGVAAAFGAAGAYAFYILAAERGVRRRDPVSLSFYGFAFATLFWLVVQPLWQFPRGALDDPVSLRGNLAETAAPLFLLLVFVIVAGTVVTFGLVAASLRHISATRAGIVATLEPVAGALVAYLWLDQRLTAMQIAGGATVLAGIALAQTARDG